jgi:hypothetical protein
MIGDEKPGGTLIFQRTFLSGPISVGGFSFSAMAEPPGPRNWGHAGSAAEVEPAASAHSDAHRKSRRIFSSPRSAESAGLDG